MADWSTRLIKKDSDKKHTIKISPIFFEIRKITIFIFSSLKKKWYKKMNSKNLVINFLIQNHIKIYKRYFESLSLINKIFLIVCFVKSLFTF